MKRKLTCAELRPGHAYVCKGGYMTRSKNIDRSAAEVLSILELQQRCQATEDRFTSIDFEKVKSEFAKAYIFSPRGFPPQPKRGCRTTTASEACKKYRALMESVRQAKTCLAKLWALAWWLKNENVCEPEELLGLDELQRVAKSLFGFMSSSEFRYAAMVDAWIPYLERLLHDLCLTGSKSKLIEMGYDESAVAAALGKRKSVPAVCDWLSDRSVPASFANAYSGIYGKERRASIQRFLAISK
jgi:hypothetical protein